MALLGGLFVQAEPPLTFEEAPNIQKPETVLDRQVHIEKEILWDIPNVPRCCDRLELKKCRVNVADCELYVEEEGEGIPIVLLHGGSGATHHGFHPEFSRLTEPRII